MDLQFVPIRDFGLNGGMPISFRAGLVVVLLGAGGLCGWGSTNRFEREVRALEAVALQNPAPQGAMMLYGSSSFRLWTDAAARFPKHDVVNRGFGGAHLSDLNEFFDRLVLPAEPRLLLIYGGDNDVASGKSPERVLEDFRELVRKVRTQLPRTRVGFVAIKPSPSRFAQLATQREANRLVRREARRLRRVDFIDVASPLLGANETPDEGCFVADRLHLNAAGYDRWMEALGPYVERRGPKRPAPARTR